MIFAHFVFCIIFNKNCPDFSAEATYYIRISTSIPDIKLGFFGEL